MAETALAAPTEALAGIVERVTYHNAENGFCVLRVKARGQRDLVTVVGHAASISAGEWVQAAAASTAASRRVEALARSAEPYL
jgi:exodeoxyribonuclease V alpha subunit